MSLKYADTNSSLNNRKTFLGSLGINYQDLVCAKQVHGSLVRDVRLEDKGKGALFYDTAIDNTDALLTRERNLPLAIFTADCLSVFLYDSRRIAIGLVHAGWQSSKENIVTKAIEFMKSEFSTQPEDISVVFGPAIRVCCYEVEEKFGIFFPGYTTQRHGRFYLDLIAFNKKQILDSGIREGNIVDSGICTSCRNHDFFSYRKEGRSCARMMSVAVLK
jgi:YfiH family protein